MVCKMITRFASCLFCDDLPDSIFPGATTAILENARDGSGFFSEINNPREELCGA